MVAHALQSSAERLSMREQKWGVFLRKPAVGCAEASLLRVFTYVGFRP
jgi:hypothetical protein